MLNQLIKITALTVLWAKYKALIASTLCLFAFFWLIGLLHADFLAYSEIEGSGQFLGLSFIIKWALWLIAIAIYLAFHDRRIASLTPTPLPEVSKRANADNTMTKRTSSDPFATIREKDSLRSKADIVIAKNKP